MRPPPWPVAVTAVVGLAVIVAVQFEGAARTALWVALAVGSMTLMGWRRWPPRPQSVALFGSQPDSFRRHSPHPLAAIEIEVAGAVDEGMREAARLRSRLTGLAVQRAGQHRESPLVGEGDVMSIEEIEEMVVWLERH